MKWTNPRKGVWRGYATSSTYEYRAGTPNHIPDYIIQHRFERIGRKVYRWHWTVTKGYGHSAEELVRFKSWEEAKRYVETVLRLEESG